MPERSKHRAASIRGNPCARQQRRVSVTQVAEYMELMGHDGPLSRVGARGPARLFLRGRQCLPGESRNILTAHASGQRSESGPPAPSTHPRERAKLTRGTAKIPPADRCPRATARATRRRVDDNMRALAAFRNVRPGRSNTRPRHLSTMYTSHTHGMSDAKIRSRSNRERRC